MAAVVRTARLARVRIGERFFVSLLFLLALLGWLVALLFMANVAPTDAPLALPTGALLIGLSVTLSGWPIIWLLERAMTGMPGAAGRIRAGRRAGLAGLAVAILVILRGLDTFSTPLLLFVIAMAVLVEAAFLLRR